MTVYITKKRREALANNPAVHPEMRAFIKQCNQDVSFETRSTTTTTTTTT
jgi:hypothetical protein